MVLNPSYNTYNLSLNDYYPFGMVMPGRQYTSSGGDYRFGFNGMEKDGEAWSGSAGNQLDFGARIYDSRLGRWQATDPLAGKYPWASPYCFVANKPIVFIDPDGRVIDWANGSLTSKQKISLVKLVNDLKTRSVMFDYIYNKLHSSSTVFTMNYYPATGTTKGKYLPSDNSINLNDKSSSSTIVEEFFHAYQTLIYGNWKDEQNRIKTEGLANYSKTGVSPNWHDLALNNRGTNIGFIESEAKLMKYLILYQAAEPQSYINDLDKRSGGSLGQTFFVNSQDDIISGKLKVGAGTLFSAQ